MASRYRSTIILLLATVSLLAHSIQSHAVIRTVEGIVKKVADGDTLTVVTHEGTKLRVRLCGIDAPEIRHNGLPGQPYGGEAKAALTALMLLNNGERNRLLESEGIRRWIRICLVKLCNSVSL
ncbi:MAG: hypothetical protein A2W09_01545 [Deltaproteobacteria bacterium RBG_16_50_11]|nr:MAG: hypothetical protein A2W09_01545 [Deltaproteobacteria bacterium RBG_16_50_11]